MNSLPYSMLEMSFCGEEFENLK